MFTQDLRIAGTPGARWSHTVPAKDYDYDGVDSDWEEAINGWFGANAGDAAQPARRDAAHVARLYFVHYRRESCSLATLEQLQTGVMVWTRTRAWMCSSGRAPSQQPLYRQPARHKTLDLMKCGRCRSEHIL